MRKCTSCLLAIALLATGACYGQSETTAISRPKHEINIGFTDVLKRQDQQVIYYPPYYYMAKVDLAYVPPYYEMPYSTKTQYGIGYKFHFGKNALRASFAYGMKDGSDNTDQGSGNITENSFSSNTLGYRIGYERTIIRQEKFDFYLAADFIASQADNSYESTQRSTDYEYISKNKSDYKDSGAGLSLGLRYFVHKNVSLSAETRIEYVTYEDETKYETTTDATTGSYYYATTRTEDGNKTSFNPLSVLSVNVHF